MGWKTTQYPAAKTTAPFTNSFTGFLPRSSSSRSDLCTASCLNLLPYFAFNLPICPLQASSGPAIPSFPRCWHCALLSYCCIDQPTQSMLSPHLLKASCCGKCSSCSYLTPLGVYPVLYPFVPLDCQLFRAGTLAVAFDP